MNSGKLVPDYIVEGVLTENIERAGEDGFLLDGYPRTVSQAEALDEILMDDNHEITHIINLVTFSNIQNRLRVQDYIESDRELQISWNQNSKPYWSEINPTSLRKLHTGWEPLSKSNHSQDPP